MFERKTNNREVNPVIPHSEYKNLKIGDVVARNSGLLWFVGTVSSVPNGDYGPLGIKYRILKYDTRVYHDHIPYGDLFSNFPFCKPSKITYDFGVAYDHVIRVTDVEEVYCNEAGRLVLRRDTRDW